MICYVLAMGKQHLGPHVVVGYGIKIAWPGLFITSPDHLVEISTRDMDHLRLECRLYSNVTLHIITMPVYLLLLIWCISLAEFKPPKKGKYIPWNQNIACLWNEILLHESEWNIRVFLIQVVSWTVRFTVMVQRFQQTATAGEVLRHVWSCCSF